MTKLLFFDDTHLMEKVNLTRRIGQPELVRDRFGDPLTIVSPGVSVKPYPCGVLTHPSMDAMASLMLEEGLEPNDIESVTLYAANNILHPIRFEVARTELEGKFCMAFLLSAIIIAGRAGKAEFTDKFVGRDDVQTMQRRISVRLDPAIAAMGFDRIRSRIEVVTKAGRKIEKWADENYRGGPDNPLSDAELEHKFLDCADGLLDDGRSRQVFDTVWSLDDQVDVSALFKLLDWQTHR